MIYSKIFNVKLVLIQQEHEIILLEQQLEIDILILFYVIVGHNMTLEGSTSEASLVNNSVLKCCVQIAFAILSTENVKTPEPKGQRG